MAGRRESPRQKMIGMMYLVLTALLALQVSSAIMHKFEMLNDSMEKTVKDFGDRNSQKLVDIDTQVLRRGNKPEEIKLAKEAKEIRKRTNEILAYIDRIKKEMIETTGGYDEQGSFKGAKEETAVEVMMIGSGNSGKAYELKAKLNDYVAFMNQTSGHRFEKIAVDAKEDKKLMNNEEQKNKDFAQLNFGQTPMVAAMAVLSEMEARVVNMENEVLTETFDKLGLNDYPIDRLKPMVRPKSDFVVAGTKYEADLFMSAISSSLKPEMEMDGRALQVDQDGVGDLSFTASGGNYIDGVAKKTWTGKIKMKKPDGTDTIYTITQEYKVVRPVIQIQSASIRSLYRNCANKLNVNVPALGPEYNPKFSTEGAVLKPSTSKTQAVIFPTGARVKLKVSSNGTFIGEEEFGVKLVPQPNVELRTNGRSINVKTGESASVLRSLNLRPVPEKNFAEQLPEESNYVVTEVEVTLARGRTAVFSKPFTGQNVDLSVFSTKAQPGDRYIIEVKKMKRRNSAGELEDATPVTNMFLIPLN